MYARAAASHGTEAASSEARHRHDSGRRGCLRDCQLLFQALDTILFELTSHHTRPHHVTVNTTRAGPIKVVLRRSGAGDSPQGPTPSCLPSAFACVASCS